jgi:hypothetical protein
MENLGSPELKRRLRKERRKGGREREREREKEKERNSSPLIPMKEL